MCACMLDRGLYKKGKNNPKLGFEDAVSERCQRK